MLHCCLGLSLVLCFQVGQTEIANSFIVNTFRQVDFIEGLEMNSIKKSRIKRVLESLDKDRRKAYSGNEDPLTKGEKSQELFRTAAQELVNVLPPSNRQ